MSRNGFSLSTCSESSGCLLTGVVTVVPVAVVIILSTSDASSETKPGVTLNSVDIKSADGGASCFTGVC